LVEKYARKITNFFQMIFEIVLNFFVFFKWGPGRIQPSHLGWAKIGPAQSQVNYSATACRNEFCLQRPRRRRRRQRREEKVAWLGGLGCAEDVWPVAQEASAKVTVAGGKGSKKKKKR
jgi:hypothetical protein